MPKQRQTSSRSLLIALALVLIVLGVIFFVVKNPFGDNKKPIPETGLTAPPATPAVPAPKPVPFTPEPVSAAAPPPPEEALKQPPPDPCAQTADDIRRFFTGIENKPYIKAYDLKDGLATHIDTIVIKLLNNPPMMEGEKSDLLTVLKNTAHFYRVLGPKDLSLLKDILTNEYNDIEYLLTRLYRWHQLAPSCAGSDLGFRFPVAKSYRYAVFFLDTLGGQSYLFRRDSHLRLLARYYCLLVIDEARAAGVDSFHIDTTDIRRSLIDDIRNADSLEYQQDYLTALAGTPPAGEQAPPAN